MNGLHGPCNNGSTGEGVAPAAVTFSAVRGKIEQLLAIQQVVCRIQDPQDPSAK